MKHRYISMLLASGMFAIIFSCQNSDDMPIGKPSVLIPTTDTLPPVVDSTEVVDTVETEPALILCDTIVSAGAHRIVFDEVFPYCCDAPTCYGEDGQIVIKDFKNPENNIVRPEDAEKDCSFQLYGQWSSFHIYSKSLPTPPYYEPRKTIIKLKENTTSKTRKVRISLIGYVGQVATITQLPSQNPEPEE